jgi:hypothetical protein
VLWSAFGQCDGRTGREGISGVPPCAAHYGICHCSVVENIIIEKLRRKARARLSLKLIAQGLRKEPSRA